MKKIVGILMPLIFIPGMILTLFAWGFYGHQQINKYAVFALPPEMFGFYKQNIEFLTVHAVDPDKRRYANVDEAARHFIDLDRYGEHPFDSLPIYWNDAIKKIPEDTLKAHGIVPWHIQRMVYRLTNAFEEGDPNAILKVSAELGHYVGDAHVPLHCTKNYNGQLTNQHGIHGLWESRLPELFDADYDKITGRCNYVKDVAKFSWEIVKHSYSAKDSVLEIERQLTLEFGTDKKYTYEEKGLTIIKVYSKEFAAEYQKRLNGMVERRMNDAILAVASCWYTAWVNAGMPELKVTEKAIVNSVMTEQIALDSLYTVGKNQQTISGHEGE